MGDTGRKCRHREGKSAVTPTYGCPRTTSASLPFSWNDVESLPDLSRLDLVLRTLPDDGIIAALEQARGRGRDDYPVAAMWRALVAGVVLQHEAAGSLLRELSCNPALLALCGFDQLARQKAPRVVLEVDEQMGCRTRPVEMISVVHYMIPKAYNFSRFLKQVIELESGRGLITAMIVDLRADLMKILPDFDRHLGYDGKAIESHATG